LKAGFLVPLVGSINFLKKMDKVEEVL